MAGPEVAGGSLVSRIKVRASTGNRSRADVYGVDYGRGAFGYGSFVCNSENKKVGGP